MFGYVNVYKENLSNEDFEIYRSFYCGLCKQIGKNSQFARIGLSNDLTFLSVLLSSVCDVKIDIENNKTCVLHHFKKHSEVSENDILKYCADMNILLTYYKICDDVIDDNNLFYKLVKELFKNKTSKIALEYPKTADVIVNNLEKISILEKSNCDNIDEISDCFAKILEKLFVPDFISDKDTITILKWIGYNIGKWIYIIDSYNDIKKDRKSKSYNTFICMENNHKTYSNEFIFNMFSYMLNNIANAYDLLEVKRYDTILRNILYYGLPAKQNSILNKTEEKDGPLSGFGSQS